MHCSGQKSGVRLTATEYTGCTFRQLCTRCQAESGTPCQAMSHSDNLIVEPDLAATSLMPSSKWALSPNWGGLVPCPFWASESCPLPAAASTVLFREPSGALEGAAMPASR